jgi:hypothetical protein
VTGVLPNLLIVGFPKCGTQALLHNLSLHPDVHTHPHEVGFFGREGLDLDAYRALFRPDRRINGEKSPVYAYREEAIRHMKQLVPEARLVVCVRHPVQWAHSFYNFRVFEYQNGFAPGFDPATHRFADMVLREREASWFHVRRGCFAEQVTRNVLPCFDRDAIAFVVQERMLASPSREMNRLFAWLGLAPFEGAWRRTRRHHDAAQRYATIPYRSWRYRRALRKLLALYEPTFEPLFELLGEEVDEWAPITARYRRWARWP